VTRREVFAACAVMPTAGLPLLAVEPKVEGDPLYKKDVPSVTIEEILNDGLDGWGKHIGKQVLFTATITNTEILFVRIETDEKGKSCPVRLHGIEYPSDSKDKKVRVCGLIVDQPQFGVAQVWYYKGEFAKGQPDEPAKAKGPFAEKPDTAYRAYWLKYQEQGKFPGYGLLLLTRGPIEKLSGFKRQPAVDDKGPVGHFLIFDEAAFTVMHHGQDSLWSDPFHVIKEFGMVEAKSVTVDGTAYDFAPCALADVLRLLDKPLGKARLHRLSHPLTGAEQTAKAFRLLLLDQIKNEKKESR
jgi:hypothetical protein